MSNIFEIEKRYLNIISEIEENGGELTEDLANDLSITEDEFKNKVEAYVNIIKSIKNDLALIKDEQSRLKSLYERKEKVIDRLQEVLISAIEYFGDIKKSGVKYINYGTGEIAIRNTEAVQVNDLLVSEITNHVDLCLHNKKCFNTLDYDDKFDTKSLYEYLKNANVPITEEDVNNIDLEFKVKVPVKSLVEGSGYNAVREIVRYSDDYKVTGNVSKIDLKPKLKENGAYTPNLAKITINKSLNIK